MKKIWYSFPILLIAIIIACNTQVKNTADISADTIAQLQPKSEPPKELTKDFKNYWYAGKAEISSYELAQARYGELRKGTAALIYVTEDFLPREQVKADQQHPDNIPVLKLNSTKKFVTGIYPYSIMQSVFYPVGDHQHALKISSSMQEWCGHVYAQINNRKQFDITSHSYFQGEADQQFSLDKDILENEIWTKIRIRPTELPTGNLTMIPSLEFCRLRHKEIKAYPVTASLQKNATTTTYTLSYPDLRREVNITFTTSFPHTIEQWSETTLSGFGSNATPLTTTAKKIKTITSDYWSKNTNKDVFLRDSLRLRSYNYN
ncbi:septum formation inhibitor Maf [Aquimarina sp. TRL1]|uniref:septum formation inhibitor Maf n=1 Tax=Aquimarina sp. (strain TRL1) TaxID=2736252 RepID=UPI00158D7D66|nr:septum formation inhibitor Maf [Aquimarina sp. TRL1]QKX06973.1 septum formation inhibitor Maf [Aquimarina sp. TRL1]